MSAKSAPDLRQYIENRPGILRNLCDTLFTFYTLVGNVMRRINLLVYVLFIITQITWEIILPSSNLGDDTQF